MKLVGLMPVRNEDWCLGLTLRAALMWCDEVVVLLHGCTDQSAEIVYAIQDEQPGRVQNLEVVGDWEEMRHRQMLLTEARNLMDATHIAIIDADEILTGNLLQQADGGTWSSEVRHGIPRGHILELPGYNLRGGTMRYHANGIWGNRWFSTAFVDDPRLHWCGDRFHHREPFGAKLQTYRPIAHGAGGIMHMWGADERRLAAKHRLYKVVERVRWPQKPVAEIERMYSWATRGDSTVQAYGTPETWKYTDVPQEWWEPYSHLMQYLDLDREPWQTAATDEIIRRHGAPYFEGLTL